MRLMMAGEAEPPYGALNLTPFQRKGLWLAVMMMAPEVPRSTTAWLMAGVGVARSARKTGTPAAATCSAAASAHSSDRNRVS